MPKEMRAASSRRGGMLPRIGRLENDDETGLVFHVFRMLSKASAGPRKLALPIETFIRDLIQICSSE